MDSKYPTISVIIPTFNSSATIDKCLQSVRTQDYPQDSVEIVIVDGGSKDNTKQIIFRYEVKLFQIDPKKQNVEYNKAIGIQKSKGELLLMLDHDNILPNDNLLKEMIQPFLDHKELVGVETLRYGYDSKNTLLDRYVALFGVADPLAFYIGKADRVSFIYEDYYKKYHPEDCGNYYLVHFANNNIPTIGANGFMIRKKILVENANASPATFFPIDVNVDLINKGFNTYAFVKDSIIHLTGHGNILDYLKRRMLFMRQYYLSEESISMRKLRRYSVYEKKDFWRLLFFILISLTLIVPLVDSIRGYRKIHDVAWFINPILCFGFVIIYGYVMIEHETKILSKKFIKSSGKK
jgi:glycosyltransferase involved in cell wall biosynthesis